MADQNDNQKETLLSSENILAVLLNYITEKRTDIINQISSYPVPIPACDAQFNYLLAQRSVYTKALKALKSIRNTDAANTVTMLNIRTFIASSDCIDAQILQTLFEGDEIRVLTGNWSLWRQDDNGNHFRTGKGLSYAEAKRLALEYEAKGHKQMYWVQPDEAQPKTYFR